MNTTSYLTSYMCKRCKWVFDLDMRFKDNPGTVINPTYCPRCGEVWNLEITPIELVEYIKKLLNELRKMAESNE